MKTFLLITLLFLEINNLHPQYSIQWVSEPNSGKSVSPPLVKDNSGNVFISGYTGVNRNYITIKYDSLGKVKWTRIYNGTGNAEDVATFNTVDNYGNVYVTGYSVGIEGNWDYLTIKYNPSGGQLWASRYNGGSNRDDQAYGVIVDNNGNVYVTGYSDSITTTHDYATIKYNSSGVLQWVRKYDVGYDIANIILLDNSDNIFITGKTSTTTTHYDITTIKYDNNGNVLWVNTYNGPSNNNDESSSMAIDNSGNVIVTGNSAGLEGVDFATIKYDNSGIQKWVKRYNSTADKGDWPRYLASDKRGNIIVTGASLISDMNGVTNYDYTTIKYDNNGEEVWVKKFGGAANNNDQVSTIAVDTMGNAYVTGTIIDSTYNEAIDVTTIKYDTSGNQVWINTFLKDHDEYAGKVIVNPDGSNIYVSSTTWYGLQVVKYALTLPQPILLNPVNNSVNNPLSLTFQWNKSNISFITYSIQISNDSLFNSFIVNDSNLIDTFKVIAGLNYSTKYFWRVIAKDSSGSNYYSSVFRFNTSNGIVLNLKVLVEGIYYPLFNQLARNEFLNVYLRESSSPYSIIDSAESIIDSIQLTGTFNFMNAPAGVYYLNVKHFNSIEVWSKTGGEELSIFDTSSYNFTSSISQAYGNNLILVGGKYCLYSGDVNQNGFISLEDALLIYNNSVNFIVGEFLPSDLNGDSVVDLTDLSLGYNNSVNFVRVVRP